MVRSYDGPFAESLKGRCVVLVGLARTGIAAAGLLKKLGAKVVVTDRKPYSELETAVGALPEGTKLALGGHPQDVFQGASLVVTSPGVPWDSPVLGLARDKGLEVISEIELVWRLVPTPWVAITGSNGKSTTTTLVGQMARAAGLKVVVGGNIGLPMAGLVDEALGADYVVAEISTFQLEGAREFRPAIAVVLNVTEDHLDRHRSFESYALLKRRIYEAQGEADCVVLNDEDPILATWGREGRCRRYSFSTMEPVERGAYAQAQAVSWAEGGSRELLFKLDSLSNDARRNLENVLAATCAARLMGVESASISKALGKFKGLEHRLEEVATINGVTFINDSKGTNVGAVLNALGAMDRPVVLIAGGLDKGGDFSPLRKAVEDKVRKMVLIGEAADRLASAFNGSTDIERAGSLDQAVRAAFRAACEGDVVLLSPACASFDMFRDFEERGLRFKEAVRSLR